MGDRYVVQRNLDAKAVDGFNKLVLAKRYLARLLENEAARQCVAQRRPDLMVDFESISATISLDQHQFSAALQPNPDMVAVTHRVRRTAR